MSSWGLLLACQGLVLDGPAGVIGFKPRWQPEDHRSFYTGPEGWGLFVQRRRGGVQTEEIQVRYGRLTVRELVFEAGATLPTQARVSIGGEVVPCSLAVRDREIRLTLDQTKTITEGNAIRVTLR